MSFERDKQLENSINEMDIVSAHSIESKCFMRYCIIMYLLEKEKEGNFSMISELFTCND